MFIPGTGSVNNNKQRARKTHQMKRLAILIFCVSALAVNQASANFVVNGSFEDHPAFDNGQWEYFTSIPGWSSGTANVPLEIGLASVYGVTGQAGAAVMELDTTHNVAAYQLVGTPSGQLTLSFLYALRKNVNPASGTLRVYWNNTLVDTLIPTVQAMSLAQYTVTALGNDKLEFRGTGTDDSYGALVDNVQVVPEPTTILAGALLLIPFGASVIRTLRKRCTA